MKIFDSVMAMGVGAILSVTLLIVFFPLYLILAIPHSMFLTKKR